MHDEDRLAAPDHLEHLPDLQLRGVDINGSAERLGPRAGLPGRQERYSGECDADRADAGGSDGQEAPPAMVHLVIRFH